MCGRYHIMPETLQFIRRILSQHNFDIRISRARDILPSELAVVILKRDRRTVTRAMTWGFPQQQGKGLVINARAESVTEKKLFRDSVMSRRCVIPAAMYYEWNKDRYKVTFSQEDRAVLYMAGFYNIFQNQERFIVITTAANDSVKAVHDRMPLILQENEVEEWLEDGREWKKILNRVPIPLQRSLGYEQQRLFLEEVE